MGKRLKAIWAEFPKDAFWVFCPVIIYFAFHYDWHEYPYSSEMWCQMLVRDDGLYFIKPDDTLTVLGLADGVPVKQLRLSLRRYPVIKSYG